MMEKSRKINLILTAAVVFLFITYMVSLFTLDNTKDNRKPFKTALVNSKYENTITSFTLQQSDSTLYLLKKDDLWLVSNKSDANFIPSDAKKVQDFIKGLTKIVNLYKISDTFSAKNTFGLSDSQTFTITYDNNQLIFGSQDFSKNYRYLMTSKNTNVYQIDSNLDKYLSASVQSWSDPYIISKAIVNLCANDIQNVRGTQRTGCNLEKLLELRHGGCAQSENPDSVPELSFALECGDTSTIELAFFELEKDIEYNVNVKYDLPFKKQKYEFTLKISGWTYSKIKEIML